MGAATFRELSAEVAELDTDALVRRLIDCEAEQRLLDSERSRVLAELESRAAYRPDGHASMFGMLRSKLHWSERECRDRMRLARLVEAHESVGESLFEGWMSTANAGAIARLFANPRLAGKFDGVFGNLMTEAARCEHDDFRRIPARWEMLNDPGARDQRDKADQHRDARMSIRDGKGRLVAEWGDFDSARNAEIFDRFIDAEFEADWAEAKAHYGDKVSAALLARTNAQRRADALSKIFERAASMPADAGAPEPLAVLHVDHHTAIEILTRAGLFPERNVDPFEDPTPLVSQLRCETGDGELINPDRVLQILLEGYVRFAIANDKGIPIHWGRRRRLFKGAARDAVISLSPRCIHAGCRVRARRTQAGHLHAHARGGRTDPDNGGPECPRHNLANETNGWRIERDRDGHWHTYRPDGTEIR